MSQPSSFRDLFNAALREYQNQTGCKLIEHPLAKRLETCDSIDSITAILQEQAQIFCRFRGDDGKLMKSIKSSIDVLYSLSVSTVLNEGISLPFPPAKAVFAGIAILLGAVKDISSSYDILLDLFASFENFLSRLGIYTGVPPTPVLTNVLVKIIVELLSTLALATKQVTQGRFKKFVKKIRGDNEIEATLQRLDRLTLDEVRATAAQTLEVVYGLVRHRRVLMDDVEGNELEQVCGINQEIVSKMNKAERDKLQKDVRQWLSPPDPWKNYNLGRESRHSGTGTWWTQSDSYAEWKCSGPSSLLWINGKPGAGKSVIWCDYIIVIFFNHRGYYRPAEIWARITRIFYFDFREDQKKDLRGLLSSLLVQLCEQSDAYSAILSEFYVAHRSGSQHASDSELLACLKDVLKLQGQATVYIIIDALDECPITTEELLDMQIPNLRICVTSRPEADIVPVLEPLAFRSVSLTAKWQVQDITEYIRFFFTRNFASHCRTDGGSPVVQFAHFSVKEYLTSTRLAEAAATISRLHVSMTRAHAIIAQACLGVLLHLDENVTEDSLEKFPLASTGQSSSPALCCICGICDVAAFLIVERSQDVNARGFIYKETPLHVASRCGHADVAQLLLEHGADADARDWSYNTLSPLERASYEGHVEVVQVLLEHGVDVKAQGYNNWAPLHYAEGEEVTRVLIKHGADANVLDDLGQAPLHYASWVGRVGTVRALLEYGVDANARDAKNATPLHLAIGPDVARLLLQYGADIHARDDEGQTPFMRATESEQDGKMDLLLEYGAEDHRTDSQLGTLLGQ
ncbi:hypothetical protein BJV77DRAFT_1066312 [Russula vinacea]|nr:hypothetical protein BJV77DRAFT_1066312 [Russula vinacea]